MTYQERVWEYMIELRIACPEAGYPASEALYSTIEAWESDVGVSWEQALSEMYT